MMSLKANTNRLENTFICFSLYVLKFTPLISVLSYPKRRPSVLNKKIIIAFFFRYLISRGYGHPQDKDSGGSDDDMSDEGPDDMLPSTSRDRLDASGMYLASINLSICVRFLSRVSRIYKSGVLVS